jgi:hypothetical protein
MASILNGAARSVSNLAYLVPLRLWGFRKANPETPVLAAGATKAVRTRDDEEVSVGPRWLTSRRGTLIATPTDLICGDWRIPFSQVRTAVLQRSRSLAYLDGCVLKVETADGWHYQFGLMFDPAWENDLPIPVSVVRAPIRRVAALRFFVFAVVASWLLYLFVIRPLL